MSSSPSQGRVFRSPADYRASVEEAIARGISVDSIRLGIWSHGDVVAVRGRLRVRQGGVLQDSRRNPLPPTHRVKEGMVRWTASSPDLSRLLAEVGLPGWANEAYVAMHRSEGVG
jgi:hypothetical protein